MTRYKMFLHTLFQSHYVYKFISMLRALPLVCPLCKSFICTSKESTKFTAYNCLIFNYVFNECIIYYIYYIIYIMYITIYIVMFTETKWICAAVLPALPYEKKNILYLHTIFEPYQIKLCVTVRKFEEVL